MMRFDVAVAAACAALAALLALGPSTALPGGPRAAAASPGRPLPRALPAALLLAVLVWAVVGGAVGAALGAGAGALLLRRARTAPVTEVPAAELALLTDLVLSALETGAAPSRALGAAERALPTNDRPALARAIAALERGDDPAAVWHDLADDPALAPLARAFGRAHETGASVRAVLGRLAHDLDRQRRADAETAARSVGVRAALPLGVCLLPSFLLLGVVPLAAGLLASVTR